MKTQNRRKLYCVIFICAKAVLTEVVIILISTLSCRVYESYELNETEMFDFLQMR
jgi:hypothetical protein